MNSRLHRITYKKKYSWMLALLIGILCLGGCKEETIEIIHLEASSMQVSNSTKKPAEGLVETKEEVGSESVVSVGNKDSTAEENTVVESQDSVMGGNVSVENEEGTEKTENGVGRLPVPGEMSFANLLLTAKEPLGNTMYIWGGGWNEEDTAAGIEARSIGVSPKWAEFAALQDGTYDYNKTRYRIHDGLDCSGYVGWVIYNLVETEDGEEGYVMGSTAMAENYASRGWGNYTPAEQVKDFRAGDIMSMKGHVWISLGTCEDGSVVLLHASPPGVILSGTLLANGEKSQAVELAESYMSTYYPEWYERYPDCSRSYSYLKTSSRMRWSEDVLSDEEGIAGMSAGEVLEWLFDPVE